VPAGRAQRLRAADGHRDRDRPEKRDDSRARPSVSIGPLHLPLPGQGARSGAAPLSESPRQTDPVKVSHRVRRAPPPFGWCEPARGLIVLMEPRTSEIARLVSRCPI
jgi:hypothetical protein